MLDVNFAILPRLITGKTMKAWFTSLLSLLLIITYAQRDSIATLKNRLTQEHNNKVVLWEKLAEAYFDVNGDSTCHYANLIIDHGKKTGDSLILASGLNKKGVGMTRKGNLTEGIELINQALVIRKNFRDSMSISASLLSLGNIYLNQAYAYESSSQFDKADEYFLLAHNTYLKSQQFISENSDSSQVFKVYHNLGSSYLGLFQYGKSMESFEQGYAWHPSATKHIYYSEYLNNIVACKIDSGLVTELKDMYQELKVKFTHNKQYNSWISFNLNYANNLCTEDVEFTKHLLNEADSLSQFSQHAKFRLRGLSFLYELNRDLEDYNSALNYLETYNVLKDSMDLAETEAKINELSLKYNKEKVEKELAEEKVKHQTSEVKRNRLLTAFISTSSLLLGLSLFTVQRLRITKLKRVQAREAYQKEINNLLQSQELKSVEAMLSGQDKERKRIAQDLHDRLGSILSATKMYFESVLPEKLLSSEKGEKACNLLDQAIDQTRLISYDLTSGVLSKFGFAAALEDLKQTVEGSGSIKMLLDLSHSSQRFTADTEINLYRIVQEAVSNILKHAEATEIKISLNLTENQYLLSIKDNGKGFDTSIVQSGMGLQNMQARAGKFKGDYSVKSEPGNGTHIHITFNPKTYEEDYYS